jgi:hypothetical protein
MDTLAPTLPARPGPALAAALGLTLLLGTAFAARPQDPRSDPRVVVEDLAGGSRSLSPQELASKTWSELGGFLLRFEGIPSPEPPAADPDSVGELTFVGGDRVRVEVLAGDGDVLGVRLAGNAALAVEVDHLRSLVFGGRVPEGRLATVMAPARGDRLFWLRPGGLDRVDGTLEEFEAGGVRFEGVLGSKLFPWREVAALFVEPLGEPELPSPDASTTLVVADLADGGRLHGRLVGFGPESCRLELAGRRPVELPYGVLRELTEYGGRVAFLSDLAPDEALEGSPFDDDLGMRWPHRVDRCVSGEPLRAGGRAWSRGLGVHAPSRLAWKLDGSWKELRGAVAVDDSVLLLPRRGSVEFEVALDGRSAWKSGVVRGGQAPLDLPALDLTGVKELALEVHMATEFHVADRADWLRLMLVR